MGCGNSDTSKANLVLIYRWAAERKDRLADLARKTAKALNLELPRSVFLIADEVIE
jgi:hypothetical protein